MARRRRKSVVVTDDIVVVEWVCVAGMRREMEETVLLVVEATFL